MQYSNTTIQLYIWLHLFINENCNKVSSLTKIEGCYNPTFLRLWPSFWHASYICLVCLRSSQELLHVQYVYHDTREQSISISLHTCSTSMLRHCTLYAHLYVYTVMDKTRHMIQINEISITVHGHKVKHQHQDDTQ